ncbi:MAG: hypothetical protein K9H14_05635 [Actinomycetia bacterium]|nr:hypothetical protein [Actinomycetes bacterium]
MAQKGKPVILYISRSSAILDERIAAVRKGIKKKINLDTDYKFYDSYETADEADIATFLSTPSFFSDNKVLILKDIQTSPASLQKSLAAQIPGLAAGGVFLVMTATSRKLNAKLMAAVKDTGTVKNIQEPTAENARKWLKEKAELDELKFSGKAMEIFLENVDYRLETLKHEYEKIYAYGSGPRKEAITREAVNRLVTRVYSLQIFDLVDSIGSKDKNGALSALDSMIKLNEDIRGVSMGAITLLHRMFKSLAYFKYNLDQEAQEYIQGNIRASSYMQNRIIAKYKKFADYYQPEAIGKIMCILNKYDRIFRDTQKTTDHMCKMIMEIIEA